MVQRLATKDKMAIATDLKVLKQIGLLPGRPHADQIKGSSISNLKELRTKFSGHVYRSLFAFDPERKAVILCGGDKKRKRPRQILSTTNSSGRVNF